MRPCPSRPLARQVMLSACWALLEVREVDPPDRFSGVAYDKLVLVTALNPVQVMALNPVPGSQGPTLAEVITV